MSEASEPRSGIPMPSLLTNPEPAVAGNRDPDRSGETGPIHDDASTDADIDDAVIRYAQQLWDSLDRIGEYLRDQVARGGSGPLLANTTPMLVTAEQWQHWSEVYAKALSVLAGPGGDQGHGEQQARLEYQNGYVYRQQKD
jgi:hypothetical protein